AQHPPIVIADEPTASLDRDTRDGVLDLLRELARDGAAVLLVSHDLDAVARVADEVRELRDGGLSAPLETPPSSAPRESGSAAESAPREARAGAPAEQPTALLALHGVSKAFTAPGGQRIQAVDDATLELRAGETV